MKEINPMMSTKETLEEVMAKVTNANVNSAPRVIKTAIMTISAVLCRIPRVID